MYPFCKKETTVPLLKNINCSAMSVQLNISDKKEVCNEGHNKQYTCYNFNKLEQEIWRQPYLSMEESVIT
jgi:hypothetical protein